MYAQDYHINEIPSEEDQDGEPRYGVFNECFYEKVIKVKADVAALLNFFSDVSIDVRW
jgi:hypothetical protein